MSPLSSRRGLPWWLLFIALAACNAPDAKPAAAAPATAKASARGKPVTLPGAVPVAAFVAEQLALAPPGTRTLVYVGATWCEPCQRFHRALSAGELDAQLAGVRVIEYDNDTAREPLALDGYGSRLIPLFVVPNADGHAGPKRIEGSIKGEGAVSNIVPRLLAILN